MTPKDKVYQLWENKIKDYGLPIRTEEFVTELFEECLNLFLEEKMKTIIHKVFIDNNDNFRYLCNQACGTTEEKSSLEWKKVTCKNCLRYKNETRNAVI